MKRCLNIYRIILFAFFTFLIYKNDFAQSPAVPDTTIIFTPSNPNLILPQSYRPLARAWGIDILMSNNGFGLGVFYRYELNDEFSLMPNFAISDVEADNEFQQYDLYGNPFIPGKKNRLLMMPLMVTVQYPLV